MKFSVICAVVCVLWISSSRYAEAEIFGDGDPDNGIEDSRQLLAATDMAHYQRFFGTIECFGRVRGIALLLSVLNSESDKFHPVLLTAKHVFPGVGNERLEDCHYQAAGKPWQPQLLARKYVSGGSSRVGAEQSRVAEFAEDWTLVSMPTWKGWKNNAFSFSIDIAQRRYNGRGDKDTPYPQRAIFIGFDEALGGFMVDFECEFGFPEPESLTGSAPHLLWDNCDSVRGSSGGVVFGWIDHEPKIAGIRVGNLFDAGIYPYGPGPGDKFDLSTNINLTRLLDQEILDAMEALSISAPD